MTGRNQYAPLRQLALLMALDTAGTLLNAFWVLFPSGGGTGGRLADVSASVGVSDNIGIYVFWTIWALRLLTWALILLLVPRLTALCKSFRRAQIWFFLCILSAPVEFLLTGIFNYRYPDPHVLLSLTRPALMMASFLYLFVVILLLEETVLLPLGNRAILLAGAELMESFGAERQAKKNRRCGKWLFILTVAQGIVDILLTAFIAWMWFMEGLDQSQSQLVVPTEGGRLAQLLALELFTVLLCFPLGLPSVVFRFFAAFRINRTWRTIEDLAR